MIQICIKQDGPEKKLDAYMVINLAFLSYVMYELFLYFLC